MLSTHEALLLGEFEARILLSLAARAIRLPVAFWDGQLTTGPKISFVLRTRTMHWVRTDGSRNYVTRNMLFILRNRILPEHTTL